MKWRDALSVGLDFKEMSFECVGRTLLSDAFDLVFMILGTRGHGVSKSRKTATQTSKSEASDRSVRPTLFGRVGNGLGHFCPGHVALVLLQFDPGIVLMCVI